MPSCGTPQSGPMRGKSRNSSAMIGAPSSAVRAARPLACLRLGWPTGMWASTSGRQQAPHRDQHRDRDRQRLRIEEMGEDDEEAEEEDDEGVAARAQLERLQRHQRDRERDAGLLAEQGAVRPEGEADARATSTATRTQRPAARRCRGRAGRATGARPRSARSPRPAGATACGSTVQAMTASRNKVSRASRGRRFQPGQRGSRPRAAAARSR